MGDMLIRQPVGRLAPVSIDGDEAVKAQGPQMLRGEWLRDPELIGQPAHRRVPECQSMHDGRAYRRGQGGEHACYRPVSILDERASSRFSHEAETASVLVVVVTVLGVTVLSVDVVHMVAVLDGRVPAVRRMDVVVSLGR